MVTAIGGRQVDTSNADASEASSINREARNFDVKERVVLITGAGQGIGQELARQFAAAGSIAVVADLNTASAKA